jgi:hypothetical protein
MPRLRPCKIIAAAGGYSTNVGYSIGLLQQSGSLWMFVGSGPNDGTCLASAGGTASCPGQVIPWTISLTEIDSLASQSGLSVDSEGNGEPPAGWSPPSSGANTGSTGDTGAGYSGTSQ